MTDDEQRIREALEAVRQQMVDQLDALPAELVMATADEQAEVFALLNRTATFTEKWAPLLVELEEAINASPPLIREYLADMLWAMGYNPRETM